MIDLMMIFKEIYSEQFGKAGVKAGIRPTGAAIQRFGLASHSLIGGKPEA